MTHPTDEELDALQAKLRNGDQMDGKTVNCKHDQCNCALLCDADDAITALRNQLADVQADLTFMTENRNKWQDSAIQRGFRIEEAEARADRAEAALAAQIEVDAVLAEKRYDRCERDNVGPCYLRKCAIGAVIRYQPHDRTALDRMLAEAREQALRDAADEMEDELAPFLSKGQEPRVYNGVKGERLRTIRLRGQVSQGLLLRVGERDYMYYVMKPDGQLVTVYEGDDVTEFLNIQKWEALILLKRE